MALALCLLLLGVGACSIGQPQVSKLVTPPDPPPVPRAKPLPPSHMQLATVAVPAAQSTMVWQPPPAAQSTMVWQAPPAAQSTMVWQAPPASSSGGRMHIVRRSDTVYAIARLHGVPTRAVIDANGLRPPYTLAIGQSLTIPSTRTHVVGRGDTVYGISRRYGVDMAVLVRMNAITPPYQIAKGQRLVIPGAAKVTTVVAKLDVQAASPPAAVPAPATTVATTETQAGLQPAIWPAPKTVAASVGPIPEPPPRAGGKFLWPVKGKLVLNYGPKKSGLHNDGINIAAARGAPVLAAENGVVAYAGNELRGFGNLLLIKHADGWMTAYAHNETILVGRGEPVRRGQIVARVGDSGNVTVPQLHFEIRKGTRAVNPNGLLGRRAA
ncbi:MAG: M23 family metallopeptidase [Kiloniellales bacterium]